MRLHGGINEKEKALTSEYTDRNLAVELQLQHLDALPGVAGFGQEDDDAKHRFDDTGAKTSSIALRQNSIALGSLGGLRGY